MKVKITIEGPPGSGKTVYASLMNTILKREGVKVFVRDDSMPTLTQSEKIEIENCEVLIRTVQTREPLKP